MMPKNTKMFDVKQEAVTFKVIKGNGGMFGFFTGDIIKGTIVTIISNGQAWYNHTRGYIGSCPISVCDDGSYKIHGIGICKRIC